ncbi:MAG: hypothetical protein RLZ96_214 [Actinomycetota bacterium]
MTTEVLSYFQTERPHLLAHRGLSQHSPIIDENSLEAFAQALQHGATHIESDVHATSDGVALLFHDDDLSRVAGLPMKIAELSYQEVSQLRLTNGSAIPTLEEALIRFPDVKLNLDVKSKGAVSPTAEVINRLNAHDRVLVSSFSSRRRLSTLRLLEQPVATSASMKEVIQLLVSHWLFGLGFRRVARGLNALQIPPTQGPLKLATAGFVRRLRNAGLEVHFWTVNSQDQAEQLVALGASGIVSDRVDQIKLW